MLEKTLFAVCNKKTERIMDLLQFANLSLFFDGGKNYFVWTARVAVFVLTQ